MVSVKDIRVANAPCSWGALEFDAAGTPPSYAQVLDEIVATGYAGTELGDWGFMPTDPPALRAELEARPLALLGAFVAVPLASREAIGCGVKSAVRVARLLREAAGETPFVVLSDATAADPQRTANAGRIRREDSLPDDALTALAQAAERIATAVRDETGLRTVFHHHCATFVEAPWEIDAVMERTDPALLGLCLDTGHCAFGGGDPVALLERWSDRVRHVHFKDCEPDVKRRAAGDRWGYLEAVRHGVFCELGRGSVDFPGMLQRLRALDYHGWIVVEQDVLPSLGTPAASAARNRKYLHSIGV